MYACTIDLSEQRTTYDFSLIGHGHYAGKDGKLYEDVSTFTTALDITKEIKVSVVK